MQDTAAYIGVPGGQESAVIQLDAGNSSTIDIGLERSWDDAGQPPEQLLADDAEDGAVTPVAGPSSASSTQGQKRRQDVQATNPVQKKEKDC